MSRHVRNRTRQKQINILHTTTRKRHSRKQLIQIGSWGVIVLAMVVATGVGLHFGIAFALDKMLYTNPAYALNKIEIDAPDHLNTREIRMAAGLEMKENLWTLNLAQIAHDVETLSDVSSATVERHFPDKIIIHITERVPVVKISGLNVDLNTRQMFYLDRDGVVLKPRENESLQLPEVIGLTDAELEPGTRIEEASLTRALQILDAIDLTTLHTSIDVQTIDLSQPLSITMITTNEMHITFRPDADCIDQQLARLIQIKDYADARQRTIRTVDLTPDVNVPVTFYE